VILLRVVAAGKADRNQESDKNRNLAQEPPPSRIKR
jgi:hypothetical protein